nr:hypothetical protein [uncultured Butyrivibrio sp.]
MMEARDVFEAACGRDDYGDNRALVRVQLGFINRETLEETVEDYVDMDNPVVEIHQNSKLTLVNLMFGDLEDPDFVLVSDMIRRFQVMDTSIDDVAAPMMSLTIMPKEADGAYVHGVCGIGVLQPSEDGVDNEMISFVFVNDCIHAYTMDMDEVDAGK